MHQQHSGEKARLLEEGLRRSVTWKSQDVNTLVVESSGPSFNRLQHRSAQSFPARGLFDIEELDAGELALTGAVQETFPGDGHASDLSAVTSRDDQGSRSAQQLLEGATVKVDPRSTKDVPTAIPEPSLEGLAAEAIEGPKVSCSCSVGAGFSVWTTTFRRRCPLLAGRCATGSCAVPASTAHSVERAVAHRPTAHRGAPRPERQQGSHIRGWQARQR